ncbi:MAG: DUF4249 domain-containing protein [Tannerellaceae bacterium]|jgi:hypothetical protein|nr:DUF4249 domain-containing protein [Tannerellaceae bacterium]
MKRYAVIFASLLLVSCIDMFEPEGIASQEGILAVDAVITGGATVVELHRTIPMNAEGFDEAVVDDATLYVECNDGSRFADTRYTGDGRYEIATGELQPDKQYRLHITSKGKEYESGYLAPLISPQIDSVSWQKRSEGQPIYINVSTHSDDGATSYYRWICRENWEFKMELFAEYGRLHGRDMYFDIHSPNNIYYCWGTDGSRTFFIGSTNRLSANVISNKRLIEIPPDSEKISELYHISVAQHRIRKEAHDYFANQNKNISQTGSIFSPIPSEMDGNIRCLSAPAEKVIGYVEVSVPSVTEQFMPELITAYEPPQRDCTKLISTTPGNGILYMLGSGSTPPMYAPGRCLDCTLRGTKNKPAFWPTDHL